MDKNRVEGTIKQVKGGIEEATGKLLGDTKMTAKGKLNKAAGKIQSDVGRVSDTLVKERK